MGNCLPTHSVTSRRNVRPSTPSGEVIKDLTEEEFFRLFQSSGIREDAQFEVYIDGTASNDHTDVGGINYHTSSKQKARSRMETGKTINQSQLDIRSFPVFLRFKSLCP